MNHLLKKLCFGLVLVAFGALLTTDAEARRRVRFHGTGLAHGARHSGPVLSREQLRQCVSQQNQLNDNGTEIDKAESVLQAKSNELERLESQIKQSEPLVNQYSHESVVNHNALISKHKRLASAYNKTLPTHNSQIETYNAEQQAFNTNCAGHAYYISDMKAVLAAGK